jgi:hypothetical protein
LCGGAKRPFCPQIKKERNITFEEVVFHIQQDHILAISEHPNQKLYANQRMFILTINDYAYLVPFVESKQDVFLKTIIPSCKATKKYLR